MTTARCVGLAGLGLMGAAFAQRLHTAGVPLAGYDIDAARCADFPGTACGSIAELLRACQSIVLALFDTDQVEAVVAGPGGVLDSWSTLPGRAVVCTSTCDPARIAALAHACEGQGIRFIEFPISGTSAQVARGDAVGLGGGTDASYADTSALLDVLCPKHRHIGEAGNGNRAKLAVNLVLGLNRAALAEGLAFGQRIGLDPAHLLDVLRFSAAASSVMAIKGPAMVARTYDRPQSRVDQSLKDFGLIRQLAAINGQDLPMANVYVELLQSCLARGEGQSDSAVIFEAILRRSHAERR